MRGWPTALAVAPSKPHLFLFPLLQLGYHAVLQAGLGPALNALATFALLLVILAADLLFLNLPRRCCCCCRCILVLHHHCSSHRHNAATGMLATRLFEVPSMESRARDNWPESLRCLCIRRCGAIALAAHVAAGHLSVGIMQWIQRATSQDFLHSTLSKVMS